MTLRHRKWCRHPSLGTVTCQSQEAMNPNELRRPGVNVEEDREVNVDAVQWLRTMAERGHDVDEVGQIAAVVGQIAQRAGGPEWRDWHPEESSPT